MNEQPLPDRIRAAHDWWLSLTQPGDADWRKLAKAAQAFAKIEGCPSKIRVITALAEHDQGKWIWALYLMEEAIEHLDPAPTLGQCTEPEELERLNDEK